jgi:ATP phosphoribosyltransferase
VIIFIIPKNSGLALCKEISREYSGELIEVRGEDVPLMIFSLLKQNKKIIGITGEDLFQEFILENKNTGLEIIERIIWKDEKCLFGKPTLCLLGPKNKILSELPCVLRVCINRKYSKIAKKYLSRLEDKGYCFEKIYLSGATEQTFVNNIADLVIDIVYSGKSAEENGLEVYDKIFESDIVLIGGKLE